MTDPSWLQQRIKQMFGQHPKPLFHLNAISTDRIVAVTDGAKFQIEEDLALQIIHAPGHWPLHEAKSGRAKRVRMID